MTRCDRGTLALLSLAAALIATTACTDPGAPTAPAGVRADVVTLAQPSKPKGPAPKIKNLTLGASTFVIDGAAVSYTAVLQNNGSSRNGIWLKAEIVQGANSAVAGGSYVGCPNFDGVLPQGNCTFTSTATASSTAPGGSALVAGAATFVLTMYQVDNDVLTPLDSRSLPITLQAASGAVTIAGLTVAPSTLVIDGAAGSWSATFENGGSARAGVVANGYVVQGTDTVPTGGSVVNCPPSPSGTLPSGNCAMTYDVAVSSTAPGGSTLVPGSATFVLILFQTTGSGTTPLATASFAVTLSDGSPTIASIVFSTTDIVIDPNQSTSYTLTVNNPGPTRTGMGFQAEFHQGTAVRGAGGSQLVCTNYPVETRPPAGTLPTGTCSMVFTTTASNFAGGSGDLTEGLADFVLTLDQNTTALDAKTVQVHLYLQQF